MPVIDEGGVVGQIVRVTPMTAEAALVTDEQVSIPVQLLRNGLRLMPSAELSARWKSVIWRPTPTSRKAIP